MHPNDHRHRRPTVGIPSHLPPGARPPVVLSPTAQAYTNNDSNYTFEITPPAYPDSLVNPWDNTPTSQYPSQSTRPAQTSRPPSRASTASVTQPSQSFAFPQPQIYRSSSARALYPHPPNPPLHRSSKSEEGYDLLLQPNPSVASFTTVSSYGNRNSLDSDDQYTYESADTELSQDLSSLSLNSEEALLLFQSGELPEGDQEWHKLVPPEAQEALGKQEVQRQSVIFEVIKSEREYVADLEAIQDVFVQRLRTAQPPIIRDAILAGFISEVFGNLNQILSYHQQMLGALFTRQQEQHPLLQSVADIVLDMVLKADFRSNYEIYIKHYPLAESHHRNELKRNRAYENFIHSVSSDPRIRKRDLITFLSRPVTRLPRLNLLLEQILKLTDKEYDHPDLGALPIILGILSDTIKSTQPGIEAAENKVKFWKLCESLGFQKGEIIDMDLYDDSRTLHYSGPVFRKSRTETGLSTHWTDLTAALLDNYFILTKEENRPNGTLRRGIMSRPIPLSYLRLASFDSPPETRRERADDGRMLESLRYQNVPLYPFTIYHASSRSLRRYTLYVSSDAIRQKWRSVLQEAMGVHKVRMDANMWFDPRTLSDHFFRIAGKETSPSTAARLSGRITSAVAFHSGGRKFIAAASSTGIYVSPYGQEQFVKVLNFSNPHSICALQTLGNKVFNRFIVHSENALLSYSLDILARVALGQARPATLDASMERIGANDGTILFCKDVQIGQRAMLIYASKRRLGSTLNLQVLEAVDTSEIGLAPRRASVSASQPLSFRPFGEPGFIPKDAYNITALAKTIGICTQDGIVIADPTNLAKSAVAVVPDLRESSSNLPMQALKSRMEGAKPLGLVRVDSSELLVIYDLIGFYITKHGAPTRSCGYIKWETKATSYSHRGNNILLFSPEFIEVRNITTGRIVQAIQGFDVRLLCGGNTISKDDSIIAAMRGSKNDRDGASDKIIELVETSEFIPPTPASAVPAMWDEWDM